MSIKTLVALRKIARFEDFRPRPRNPHDNIIYETFHSTRTDTDKRAAPIGGSGSAPTTTSVPAVPKTPSEPYVSPDEWVIRNQIRFENERRAQAGNGGATVTKPKKQPPVVSHEWKPPFDRNELVATLDRFSRTAPKHCVDQAELEDQIRSGLDNFDRLMTSINNGLRKANESLRGTNPSQTAQPTTTNDTVERVK